MKITQGVAVTSTFNSVNVLAEVLVEHVLSEWLAPVQLPDLNRSDFYLWNKVNVNNPLYHKKCKASSRRKFQFCHLSKKFISRSKAFMEAKGISKLMGTKVGLLQGAHRQPHVCCFSAA